MKKKILISLFAAGVLSTTAFAKSDHENQQNDVYSYVLQGIFQIHKDFLNVSIPHINITPQDFSKGLIKNSQEQNQPMLLSQLSFSNRIFNGTLLMAKNTTPQQNIASELPVQLTSDSDVADVSGQDARRTLSQFVGSPAQLTSDSDVADVSGQSIEEVSQVNHSASSGGTLAPPPPPFATQPNFGQLKKGAGFNFGDVIEQLKRQMDGSGLRSTKPVSQGQNDQGIKISLGQMGEISGNEAQKFADRFAKLREAAEANVLESVGTGGTSKVEVSTPKTIAPKKQLSPRALLLQKKTANPISAGSMLDQLKQAKLNKVAVNNTTKKSTNSVDLKGNLLSELKKGASLRSIGITTTKSISQDAPLSIEDLEAKLTNTKDLFFRRQIQRQIDEMKVQALPPKIENISAITTENSSSLPSATLLPLVSGENKGNVLPISLPTLIKESPVQEKEEIVQLGAFSFNAAVFNKFKQENTTDADDEDNSEWDDEDGQSVTTTKITNTVVIQEELPIKTETPKVGKLTIATNTGGDFLSQIRAARSKIEAVETDQVKIQTVLDAENIRARKKEQEERERNLQERQTAKLNPKKENRDDDIGSLLMGTLNKRRAALIEDEDEGNNW